MHVVLIGIAATGAVAWNSWRTGTDPIAASVAVVVIAAVCIVYLLWQRPDFYVACGMIVAAVAASLLL